MLWNDKMGIEELRKVLDDLEAKYTDLAQDYDEMHSDFGNTLQLNRDQRAEIIELRGRIERVLENLK